MTADLVGGDGIEQEREMDDSRKRQFRIDLGHMIQRHLIDEGLDEDAMLDALEAQVKAEQILRDSRRAFARTY